MPVPENMVAAVSCGRFQGAPVMETPALARRSITAYAKLSVLPSFQPRRPKTPTFLVSSCSTFRPNPYFKVPGRCSAATSGEGIFSAPA